MIYKNKYNEAFLIDKYKTLKQVEIIYESKYDIEIFIPKKLYHLSIQQYKDKILKQGLIPKSKNKKIVHLDRIYLCTSPEEYLTLIPTMNIEYQNTIYKNKLKILIMIGLFTK